MYEGKVNYENLHNETFEMKIKKVGMYDIPSIKSVYVKQLPEMIGFNFAKTAKEKENKGLHFFLDDYQFVRLWRNPQSYINLLSQFRLVLTPDFSLYTDYPMAMQIYNHYRKHWLGAYWQQQGITVIPTICWGEEKTFDWCFDGEPKGGTVAVSSVGTQRNKKSKELFIKGYKEMINRLDPETVLFYGNVPDDCSGNIVKLRTFQEKFREGKN